MAFRVNRSGDVTYVKNVGPACALISLACSNHSSRVYQVVSTLYALVQQFLSLHHKYNSSIEDHRMRLLALVPLALSVAALILSSLCLFAGSKKGFLEEYAIVTVSLFSIPKSW